MADLPTNPAVPGVPATRRELLYLEIATLSRDVYVARYALTRALDNLDLPQLEALYDEIDFVVYGSRKE